MTTWQPPVPGRPIVAVPALRTDEAIEYAFRHVLESITSEELPVLHQPVQTTIVWKQGDTRYYFSSSEPTSINYYSPLDTPPEAICNMRVVRQEPPSTAAVAVYEYHADERNPQSQCVYEPASGVSWEQDWQHGWPYLRRVLLTCLRKPLTPRDHAPQSASPAVALFRQPEQHRWPMRIRFFARLVTKDTSL
jgi:hypothetical protein